ncbi:TPR domain protein [Bisporella sp. PMI_857]|nr:TPR domain protein [Bisporella sp. PMI_857]
MTSTDDDYYNLGSYTRKISTVNRKAQTWFNRGLIWTYGFNHDEATKCFERALEHDPCCAILYWGVAYSQGPNYNKPWEVFDEDDMATSLTRTHLAVAQAKHYSLTASPVEFALVEALHFRYQKESPVEDFSVWSKEYASAMQTVYAKFPDDLDIAALYADALMNLTPWKLWDLSTGQPAEGARTLEAKRVLDLALSKPNGSSHPGLLHLYIHLMEMSSKPEAALTIADHLRDLVPDSGHLNHMPTHLDILCGDYRRAVASNKSAILADQKFLAKEGPINFYTLYRSHDYHFRIYAAMFSGQSEIALQIVEQLEKSIPEDLLRVKSPPMADWLEGFLSTRIHVLVRFGKWQDLISLSIPADSSLYCVTTAMIHYGRGIAYAATGNVENAEKERLLFQDAVKQVPHNRTLFNNRCIDILTVASSMLDGEMAYRHANFDLAFETLRTAIALEDTLPYDEPWGWMQPTRHAYGALLLEQGEVERAAAVYSADLGMDDTLPRAQQHPNNVWALHGFHECLISLGRPAEAKIIELQLRLALAVADVPVASSCFCRLKGPK